MPHLDPEQLSALSRGTLPEPEATAARAHVETCEACRALLASKVGHAAAPTVTVMPGKLFDTNHEATPTTELARGSAIGRYLVHARVGVGGMGEVYSAVDPELGRKVALKLVAANAGESSGGSGGQLRLLREAQAMAQLSHPSVVTIFDVGTYGGGVFLAMELVEGQTLRAWLGQKPRTQAEVLALFAEAGRGLAAAHRAGLVHRDFKPDNVLVDASDHARVTDFGLARSTKEKDEPVDLPPSRLLDEVTLAGTAMGTPGYMSPEQFRGGEIDGRTDQFSFCVTLYKALYDAPPFDGKGPELERNVLAGTFAVPPAGKHVPDWLRAVVLKGLAAKPADRFPSMEALLEAMEKDPSVARRTLAWRAASVLAVGLVVLGGLWLSRARGQLCAGGPSKIAPVWNATARAQLQATFGATQKSYAIAAGRAVEQELDARTAQWVAGYTEACEATRVRGEQSDAELELRQRCLDDRLGELKALIDVLSHADEKAVRRAVQAVTGLETVRACADVASLSLPLRPPADPAKRAEVDSVRERLAAPRAQFLAGRFQEGLVMITPLVAAAKKLEWLPLVAEARLLEGQLLTEAGKAAEAEVALLDAVVAAEASRHDLARAHAEIALAAAVGLRLGKTEAGESWGNLADGILQRLGQPDELVGALWSTMGALSDSQGQSRTALQRYERSLAARERAFGRDSFPVGYTLNNLGVTATTLRDFKRADEALERALALQRAGLGEGHPALAAPMMNLGTLRMREGEGASALLLQEQAETVAASALGQGHPTVGNAIANQAETLISLKRWTEAEERARKALAIFDAKFPDGSIFDVYVLRTQGEALLELGRNDEALAALERGLKLLDANPAPPEIAAHLRYLLARAIGKGPRALELAMKARKELPAEPADLSLPAAMDALLLKLEP